jgi:hypothetical protein
MQQLRGVLPSRQSSQTPTKATPDSDCCHVIPCCARLFTVHARTAFTVFPTLHVLVVWCNVGRTLHSSLAHEFHVSLIPHAKVINMVTALSWVYFPSTGSKRGYFPSSFFHAANLIPLIHPCPLSWYRWLRGLSPKLSCHLFPITVPKQFFSFSWAFTDRTS